MVLDLCFLDYVWRGLSAGAVSTTLLMLMMAVVPRMARGASARVGKWFFNFHYLALAGIFAGSFFYLAAFDRDLAVGCFRDYVRDNGAFTLTRVIAEGWMAGVVGLLLWDVFRIGLASLVGRALERCASVEGTVISLRRRLGLRREVSVYLTDRTVSPHVCGMFRPKIVIPRGLLQEPAMFEAVLAHELVHVRERDALWLYGELILRRLLFFHPLVYWLARDYRECVERAADEQAVLRAGVSRHSLVQSLIHVAANYRLQPAPFEPAVSRGFREIKMRIEALGRVSPFRLSRNLIYLLAPVLSVGGSLAQARGAAVKIDAEIRTEVRMCRQVNEEQMLRSWLNLQNQANKCEK